MAGLADELLEDGNIGTLDAAAPWRMADADALVGAGRVAAAVYLYGYAVEIRLTAACYRLKGHGVRDPIGRMTRERLERDARRQRLMTASPHDLVGWGKLLVAIRKAEKGGFDREFRDELLVRVGDVYDNWRPRLRYRALAVTAAQRRLVTDGARWVDANYVRLWS